MYEDEKKRQSEKKIEAEYSVINECYVLLCQTKQEWQNASFVCDAIFMHARRHVIYEL